MPAERVGVAVCVASPLFDARMDGVEPEREDGLEDVRDTTWGKCEKTPGMGEWRYSGRMSVCTQQSHNKQSNQALPKNKQTIESDLI